MKKETTAVYTLSEETARVRPSDYLSQATYVRRRLRQPTFVRVAFGIIWSVDAWFKWQPEFQRGFFTLVQTGAANQPGWLEPWYQF